MSSFNKEYVTGFKNSKDFIDHYKTIDKDHGISDDEMKSIYLENKPDTANKIVDKTPASKDGTIA